MTAASEAPSELRPEPIAPVRRDGWFLATVLAGALLLRLQALLWPLKPDEAGFLIVARTWDPQPDSVFGPYFLDRTPVVIAVVRLTDLLGGPYGARVLAAGMVLLLVYAAYRIGALLGGTVAARWTAVAAVAFTGQPDLEMWAAKGESFGVPLVVVSCWLSLEALHRRPGAGRLWCAAGAGCAGALALGMKQSLVGGGVFGVVLLVMALRTQRVALPELGRLAAAAGAGFAVPVLAVIVWSVAEGVSLSTLWYTAFGFRADALEVITAGHMDAPRTRLDELGVLFVETGLALVLGWFLVNLRTSYRVHAEVTVAVLVVALVDAIGLLLSGSYWTPYLTALFPSALLAVAAVTSVPGRWRVAGMKVAAAFAVVSMVLTTVGWTAERLDGQVAPTATYIGEAVAAVAEPEDTILVLYGRPDIVLASGLTAPYPYLWSLPARTLDPGLADLHRLLAGDAAPTWVVGVLPLNSWGIDADGTLGALLETRYVEAGEVCGRPVWVRADVDRSALPSPDCRRPWL